MASELATIIMDRFIQRRDVYALQNSSGGYRPIYQKLDADLVDKHLAGEVTLGHYLADTKSMVRVLCFDVDLEKEGVWVEYPDFSELPTGLTLEEEDQWTAQRIVSHEGKPREEWQDRAHPARSWYKQLFRRFADELSAGISRELEIPTLTTYSGSKGVHVYGFLPEPMHASEARAGAQLVMRKTEVAGGKLEPYKGKNFYKVAGGTVWANSVSVEVFPKQDSMEGKKLGNLIRLPLGRNLKSIDPTFVIDSSRGLSELVPADPLEALRRVSGALMA